MFFDNKINLLLVNVSELLDNVNENFYQFDWFFDSVDVDKYGGFFYNIKSIKKYEIRNFLSFFGGSALSISDDLFLIKMSYFLSFFKNESLIYLFMMEITAEELYNILNNKNVTFNVLYLILIKFNKRLNLEIYRFFLIYIKTKKKKQMSFKKFKEYIIANIYLYDTFENKELYKYYMYLDSENFYRGLLNKNFVREYYYENYFVKNFYLEYKSFYEIILELINNLIKTLYNLYITNMNYNYSFTLKKMVKNYLIQVDKHTNYIKNIYVYFHEFLSLIRLFLFFFLRHKNQLYFLQKIKNRRKYIKKFFNIFELKFNLFFMYLQVELKNLIYIDFFYQIYQYIKYELYLNLIEKKDFFFIELQIFNTFMLKKINYFFLFFIQKIRLDKIYKNLVLDLNSLIFSFSDYFFNLFTLKFNYKRLDLTTVLFDFNGIYFDNNNKVFLEKYLLNLNFNFFVKYNLFLNLLNRKESLLVYNLTKRSIMLYKEPLSLRTFSNIFYLKINYLYNKILFEFYNFNKPVYVIFVELFFVKTIRYFYTPALIRIYSQIEYLFDLVSDEVVLESFEDYEQDIFLSEILEPAHLEADLEDMEDYTDYPDFEELDFYDSPLVEFFEDVSSVNYYTLESYINKYSDYRGGDYDDIETEGISFIYDYYNDSLSPYLNRKLNFEKFKIEPLSWFIWIQNSLVNDLMGFQLNYYDIEVPFIFNFFKNKTELRQTDNYYLKRLQVKNNETFSYQKMKLFLYFFDRVLPVFEDLLDYRLDDEDDLEEDNFLNNEENFVNREARDMSRVEMREEELLDFNDGTRKKKKEIYQKIYKNLKKDLNDSINNFFLKYEINDIMFNNVALNKHLNMYLIYFKDLQGNKTKLNEKLLIRFTQDFKLLLKHNIINLSKNEKQIFEIYYSMYKTIYEKIPEKNSIIKKYNLSTIDYSEDKLFLEYNLYNKHLENFLGIFSLIDDDFSEKISMRFRSFMLLNETWIWWDIIKKANSEFLTKMSPMIIPDNIEEFLFMNVFVLSGLYKKLHKYNFIYKEDFFDFYNQIDFYLDSLLDNLEKNLYNEQKKNNKVNYKNLNGLFFFEDNKNIEEIESKKEIINEFYTKWNLQYNNLYFFFDYFEIIQKLNIFDKLNFISKDFNGNLQMSNFEKIELSDENLINKMLLMTNIKEKENKLSINFYQLDQKMKKVLNYFIKDSINNLYSNYYLYDKQDQLKYFWNHLFLGLNESLYYYLNITADNPDESDEDELEDTDGYDPPYIQSMDFDYSKLVTNYGLIDDLEDNYYEGEDDVYTLISPYINKGLTDSNLLLSKGLNLDYTLSEMFGYELYLNYVDYITPTLNYDYHADDQSLNNLKLYDMYDDFRNMFFNEVEIGEDDDILNADAPNHYDEIETQFDLNGFLFSEKKQAFDSVILTNYRLFDLNKNYIDQLENLESNNNLFFKNFFTYLKGFAVIKNINLMENTQLNNLYDVINNLTVINDKRNFLMDKDYLLNLKLNFFFINNIKIKEINKEEVFGHLKDNLLFLYQYFFAIYFYYLLIVQTSKINVKIKNIFYLIYNSYVFFLLMQLIYKRDTLFQYQQFDLIFLQLLKLIKINDNIVVYLKEKIRKFVYFFFKSFYSFKYKKLFLKKYKNLISWSLKKNVLNFFFKFFNLIKFKETLSITDNLLKKVYGNINFITNFNDYISTLPLYIKQYDKKFNNYMLNLDDFVLFYIKNIVLDYEKLENNLNNSNLLFFKEYNQNFFFEKWTDYLNLNNQTFYDYIEYSDLDLEIDYFDDDYLNDYDEDFLDTDEWSQGPSSFLIGDHSEEKIQDVYDDENYPEAFGDQETDLEEFDFLFDLDESYSIDKYDTEYHLNDTVNDYKNIPLYLQYDRFLYMYNTFIYKNIAYLRLFMFKLINLYRKKTVLPNMKFIDYPIKGYKNKWIDKAGFSDYDSKYNLKEVFKSESFINFDNLTNSIFEKLIMKYAYVSNYLDFFDYLAEFSEEDFFFDDEYFGEDINNLVGFNSKTLYNITYIEMNQYTYFNKLLDIFKYFILSFNYLNFIDSNLKVYNIYMNFFFELKINFLKNLNYIFYKYNYINNKIIKFIFNKTYQYSLKEIKKINNFFKIYQTINNKEIFLKKYVFENKNMFKFLTTPEEISLLKEIIDYLFYIDNYFIFNFSMLVNCLKKIFYLKKIFLNKLSLLSYFFLIKYFELYYYFNINIMVKDYIIIFNNIYNNFYNFELFVKKNSYNIVQIYYKNGLHELLFYLKNKELVNLLQVKINEQDNDYFLYKYLILFYQIFIFLFIILSVLNFLILWMYNLSDFLWPYFALEVDEARVEYKPFQFTSTFDYLLINFGFSKMITQNNDYGFDPFFF